MPSCFAPSDLLAQSRNVLLLVALCALVASCASKRVAPVEDRGAPPPKAPVATAPAPPKPAPEPDWRPPTYTVKRGDTLFQIALDHGLDYRDIAAWNGMENPNRILVGQVLRLSPPGAESGATTDPATGVTTAPLRVPPPVGESRPSGTPPTASAPPAPATAAPRNSDTYKTSPKAIKEPYSAQAARELAKPEPPVVARAEPSPPPSPASAPAAAERPPTAPAVPPGSSASAIGDDDDGLDWMWPAKGKVIGTFSDASNLKGIDIAGSAGQPVVAAAPGKVVYAGSGLRGYGKLVIIKHNKTYLSAYAHNREIVVKEGQQVQRGQRIAEMGSTDTEVVKLHFEIRRLGKPMDPAKYLPPA